MDERIDILVAGAGVVGLAIARRLALAGREVVVAEAGTMVGTGISSRSSEVIHAGSYYPAGSLKALLCVRGRELLYQYCETHDVDFRRVGKFITATTDAETKRLEEIAKQAAANGVNNLVLHDKAAMRRLEPELACVAALSSPSTGTVDSHGFMLSLQAEAERSGALIAFCSPIVGGVVGGAHPRIRTGGPSPAEVACSWFVNASRLGAVPLALNLTGLASSMVPTAWLCKGHYVSLRGPCPFSHLIYPIPEAAGLGVHLTLDMVGRARFGPDTLWVDKEDYDVPAALLPPFRDRSGAIGQV